MIFILEKLRIRFDEFINQLFSSQCRLTSLRLDVADIESEMDVYRCLKCQDDPPLVVHNRQFGTLTLRRLHIHIRSVCSLEHILEHVPALEKLSVRLSASYWQKSTSDIETLIQSNGNWFHKVKTMHHYISLKDQVKVQFSYRLIVFKEG
jgi:hypothetical protein